MTKEKEVVLKCSVSKELERVITHIQLNKSRITRATVTKAEILLMIVKLALKSLMTMLTIKIDTAMVEITVPLKFQKSFD